MKEYIERETLLQELAELYDNIDPRWQRGRDAGLGLTMVKKVIENQPAGEVQDIRHGEWTDKGSLSCRCSECGCKSNRESNFCPNCGAKMDKE